MLTVIDCPKIAGADSPIFKIAGATALVAPVLNRSLENLTFFLFFLVDLKTPKGHFEIN